jgi:serine phosphatase RsbU (regulator of sigma subunit)/predicted negative regulator of RcsB-dependent stress response
MKTTIKTVLVAISVLICSQKPLLAQKRDSLSIILNQSVHDTLKIKSLRQIGKKHFLKREYDSCEIYAKSALSISEKIGNKHHIAVSNKILGQVYLSKNDNASALKYYLKAVENYRELNDTTCSSYIFGLNDIGYIYSVYGMYPKSYGYYLKALKTSERLNDSTLILNINLSISELYSRKREFDKSISLYNSTIKLVNKNEDTLGYLPIIYNGLANNYLTKKQYDKSILYFNRVINIGKFTKQQIDVSAGQVGIGSTYMQMNKYDSAIKYLNTSLIFKTNNSINNAYSYNMLGAIYVAQNNYILAKQNTYKSLEISKHLRLNSIICDNYRNLYILDSCTKNYKSYIKNYALFIAYNDSLNNIESERKIVSAEMNYYFDKEKETQKLRQAELNKITELESNRKSTIITGIVIVLIILVLFSLFIYKSYLGKNKANKIITQQKHLVEEKQKEILDNITYAKRIQTSIIPTEEYITKYAKNNFVMYNPKDIVSGDFYWATERDNKFYLATADCTGHGVSGAMVSMMNVSILNEVVNQKGITNTGEILNEVRNNVIKSLNPKGNEGVNDGMDCVLCAFDFDKKTLQYSASNNSFYIIRNKELIVCKADKMPIGLSTKMDSFKTNEIQLQSGDVVYMFTDGYADQFGGENNKKFKYKQLEELLISVQDFTMTTQKNVLIDRFNAWKGNNEQTDDVLIIGIKM